MTDRLLTSAHVAEILAVPVTRVRESSRSGGIPCVGLGRYVRFEQTEVEAWLEGGRQPGRAIAVRRSVGR